MSEPYGYSDPPKTYQGVYLILSLKWSDSSDRLIFWAPDNNGYSADIDAAGRYTAEKIQANQSYYDNDDTTRAVPLYDVMEGLIGPVRRIVDTTFRYPMKSYDCHACERTIKYRVDPRFSLATCFKCGKSVCEICADERRCDEGSEEHSVGSATEEAGA